MPVPVKNASNVQGTYTSTGSARTRQSNIEPQQAQIIHQIVIPEHPTGLIGEKVVYNEKYLKKAGSDHPVPVPSCGYFTIVKAVLDDRSSDAKVMVALYPYPSNRFTNYDGTHIALGNMKRYESTIKIA